MLKICSKALLLSCVPHFVTYISDIAKDVGVELDVADEWNTSYRMKADVIICGSMFLKQISAEDYSKVRLVLKTTETVSKFIDMGITHFIFDYKNTKEVSFAFFVSDKEKKLDDLTMFDIMDKSKKSTFITDRYDFDFKANKFKYNGVGIYLRNSEKLYLAKWVLLGDKENDKRVMLYRMRKKFGMDFMKDIDRLGNENNKDVAQA